MRRDIQLGSRRATVAGLVHVQPGLAGAHAVVSVSPHALEPEPRFADAEDDTDPGPRKRAEKGAK